MLKNNTNGNYKVLARKTRLRKMQIKEFAINSLAIDVRSCMFKYIRTIFVRRTLHEKILCVLRMINYGIALEIKYLFDAAFADIVKKVEKLNVHEHVTYVFCAKQTCSLRSKLQLTDKALKQKQTKDILYESINKYKKHLLSTKYLIECHTSFEKYIFNHVNDVSTYYDGYEHFLSVYHIKPTYKEFFESDRLCAMLNVDAILSEDFDCITLFGAKQIICDVSPKYVTYTTLEDVMHTFDCNTREELVYKCCIIGTDYNLGIKGIGPAKLLKLYDSNEITSMVENCFLLQSIDIEKIRKFFLLEPKE